MGHGSLNDAKIAKKDEFYTQLKDVEREMTAYLNWDPNVFRDKTVLLPCDDPEWSSFTKFFTDNFSRLGLKKLISTCCINGLAGRTAEEIEEASPLFNPGKNRSRGRFLVIERDSSEFKGHLEGDGDFRSPEVQRLRDEADIIVTNPPFSLFREFFSWIQKGRKQFIIVGHQNAITYKEIFPLLKEDKMWLGAGFKSNVAWFTSPYESTTTASGRKDGMIRVPGVCWFTNVDHSRHHQVLSFNTMADNLQNNAKLRKKLLNDFGCADAYPKYDNYDAIEVPFTDAIPNDYDGAIGVPVTFLYKYSPEQFEILGSFNDGSLKSKEADGCVPSTDTPTILNGVEQMWNGPVINKKPLYKRIIVRLRHPKPQVNELHH